MTKKFHSLRKHPRILDVIIHPERNGNSKLHDIAILVLQTAPPYTDFIRPICLPDQPMPTDDLNDSKGVLFVAGWGWTIGCKYHYQIKFD